MSALAAVSRDAIWTAFDAYLTEYPFNDNPEQIVSDIRLATPDNLPTSIVIHPEFRTVSHEDLCHRIEQYAITLDTFISEHSGR